MSRLAGRGNLVRLAHKTVVEQQLVDYIKKAKAANQQDAQTRTLLAKNGWTEAEINDAFSAVNPPQAVSKPPVEKKPETFGQSQSRTEPQVSGQPKIDVRPQIQSQPQYNPQAQPASRPQIQPQAQPASQPRPQPQTQYSRAQQQSSMPRMKTKSHLLAKILVTLVVLVILAGAGIYSSDKFLNTNILSYIKSILPWNPLVSFEPDPQTVINSMLEKMDTVTSSHVTAQMQGSVKTGDVTQGSVSINVVGGSDTTDVNNPKSEATVSFSFSQSRSATPTASAGLNLITIGDVGYIKLNNIVLPPDSALSLGSDISQLQNKFFKIDQESADILASTNINSSQIPVITPQEKLDFGNNIRDLVLIGGALSFNQKLADEKINGQDTYHYLLTIKKEKIQEFLNQIMVMQAEQFPEMNMQSDDIKTTLESVANAIGDIDVEVWIGKSDYFLYQVKTNKTLDISKVVPILNLQVNVMLNATYSDYNKQLNIQEPQESQKIEDVILSLMAVQEVVSNLDQVGFTASGLFSANQSYNLVCKNGYLNGSRTTSYGSTFVSVANNLIKLGAKNPICFSATQDYCVSTQLADGSFLCVDKNGLGNIKCTSAQTICSTPLGLPE